MENTTTALEEQEEITLANKQVVDENDNKIEENSLETNEEVLKPLVLESLEDLGLTEIELFKEELNFDENLDLDSKEGITEVIKRSLGIGAKMFIEDVLKAKPDLYQLYLHMEAGNSFDSFVNSENNVISLDNLKNDISLQSKVYKEDLIKKGLEEDIAEMVVKKAIDSETLFDKSKSVIDERNKQLSETIKQKEELVVKEKEEQIKITNIVAGITEESLVKNSLFDGLLNIPESKKQGIFDSFLSTIVVEKGVAYYKLPLEDSNIKRVIENHIINNDSKVRDKIFMSKLQKVEVRRIGDTKKKIAPVIESDNKEERISVNTLIRG